jgi:hypothetical protein
VLRIANLEGQQVADRVTVNAVLTAENCRDEYDH